MRRHLLLSLSLVSLAFAACGDNSGNTGTPTPTPSGTGTPSPNPTPTPTQELWSQSFGDDQRQTVYAVAVDSGNNVWIAGEFNGAVNFGGGALTSNNSDIFLAKFDEHGTHLYSASFGDDGPQAARGLAIDSNDNVFLAGDCGGTTNFGGGDLTASVFDICLAKFSSTGMHLQSRLFGGANVQQISGIGIDSNDDLIIAGTYSGSIDFDGTMVSATGATFPDVYIATIDGTDLSATVAQSFGDTNVDEVHSLAVRGTTAWVGGRFQTEIDFTGTPITASGGAGDYDGYLVQISSTGTVSYAAGYGSAGDQSVDRVGMDANSNVCAGGSFEGTINLGGGNLTSNGADVFLGCLDSNGGHLWSGSFGDAAVQDVDDVAIGPDRIFVTGSFSGTVDFGGGPVTATGVDGFWVELDLSGNHQRSNITGDAADEWIRAVGLGNAGQVYMAGEFDGSVDFGDGVHTAAGQQDVFLVRDPS